MKVRPTCTDSAGNGYYRGTDGKYYYGNVKNGYLKETLEERNKRLAKMRSEQKAENLRVKQKKDSTPARATESTGASAAGGGVSAGGLIGGIGAFFGMLAAFAVTAAVMGPIIVIGIILSVIVSIIGLVVIWVKQYGVVHATLSEYGVNWATILIVLPMILTLVVFLICIIRTIMKHKLYVPHLLISYMILFSPYAFIQRGGVQAFQQGLMRFGDLLMADLNCALACGLVPMIALFLFYWVDKKMQNEKLKKSQGTVPPEQGQRVARFCICCGIRVPTQDAVFCEKCGTRLNS